MELWMLLLSVCVLVLVSASAMGVLQWLWPDAGLRRLNGRVNADAGAEQRSAARAHSTLDIWIDRLPPMLRQALTRISRWSLPEAQQPSPSGAGAASGAPVPPSTAPAAGSWPDDRGRVPLDLQLVRAGWRSPHALWLFGASKSLLALLGLGLGAVLAWRWGQALPRTGVWGIAVGLAAMGYLLPHVVLHLAIQRRRQQLFRAFPDALDMLRIAVQAGLGLDAGIERVGRDIGRSSPALSQEWRLTGLELRAGASRRLALQHMAERVGLREVDAMVTMLIQADRFGTRMSDALKVHAQVLRTQRKQQAEAAAAQLPVKLLIPLIFCIFPALLTVIVGPVGLSLYAHFSQTG